MRRILCPLSLAIILGGTACVPTTRPPSLPGEVPPSSLAAARSGWPGKRADGSVQLPNQWSLQPAGRQIELGDFPVNIAVHPSGEWLAVLHAGYGEHEIQIVD